MHVFQLSSTAIKNKLSEGSLEGQRIGRWVPRDGDPQKDRA